MFYRFTGECLFCKEGYFGEICNFHCSEFCTIGANKPECEKAGGRCASCVPGHYGPFCDGVCSDNCGVAKVSGVAECDRNSSVCLHGCAAGWYNHTCEDRCNSKCQAETCNRDDGKCTNGCVKGYEGEFCSKLSK